MVVMPYILFSDKDITRIKNLIDLKVQGWCESVFGEVTTNASSLESANLMPKGFNNSWTETELEVQFEVRVGAASVLMKVTTDSVLWLSSLGVLPIADNRDPKKTVIRNEEVDLLLGAVTQDLCDAISALNTTVLEPLSEAELLHYSAIKGSGVLFYSVNLHGLSFRVLMDGRHFKTGKRSDDANPLAYRKEIDSRISACAEFVTHLNAYLGTVEISIGDLSKIAAGDVIRLDASISDLVSLGVSAKQAVCSGNLGTSDGRKALRIVN